MFFRISFNKPENMEDIGVEGAIWVRLSSSAMPRIAEIDRAILAALRANGRISYVDLAKEVGASERTVRTHVRKLEEDGTIRGYTIREGGVGLTALVRIKVAPGQKSVPSLPKSPTGRALRWSTRCLVRRI